VKAVITETLRLAQAKQIPLLRALELGGSHWPLAEADLTRLFWLERAVTILICAGDAPAGYLIWRTLGPKVRVERLLVSPRFRRKGIGRRTLDWAAARARSAAARFLTTEVRELDLRSQLFLAACGWSASAMIDGFYRRRAGTRTYVQNALQFVRRIDGRAAPELSHFGAG
jgi:GNAT superfamily N-acetyltransferase